MGTNYSEQIFQSIDTIISQRLNEVSFDKTEICKIISQDENDKRKYLVSNGSLKYEAYSDDENRNYFNNQKVYVRITNGDYSLRKIITGSYAADDTNENLYVNPFNHLVTSSALSLPNSIWAKVNDEEYDEWDDTTSNKTKPNSIEFLTNFKYKNIQDFDYIGLDFSFNTNIIGYQGSYALRLSLWNGETELTNKDDNTLILSSKNLYGNPYNLNSSLSFQHLFPWPTRKKDNIIEPIPITEITKIKLQLIQDNNFLRKQGENNVNINSWIELVKADLKFGYDINSIVNDELQLILQKDQNLKYTTNDTISKTVYLNWQHFDNNNTPFIFNINQIPNMFEYYNIYWLHYVDGLGKNSELDDSLAWNWETISKNKNMQQTLNLTTLYNTDQYKVVIQYKYKNNEQIYNAISNAIIFENTQVAAEPGATNNSDESLRLSLAEGDTGIYNIYGLDGRMVNTSKKNHIITAAFLDGTSWDDKKIETIIWKFPDSNTMVLNGAQDSNNKNKATFDINSYYKPGAMNNRIWCEVTFVTGEIRRGSLTLQFGEISTAGTSYAFNIDFVGHNTCVYANNTDKVKIKATFEKANGEVMTIPTITWSWVTSNSYKNNNPLISGSGIKIEGSGDEIQLSYSGTTVPAENYSILQATISDYAIDNGLTSNLTAYLPIPIAYQDYNYISGATRLVYAMDNQSVSKSNDDYRLYQINNNREAIEVENTSWHITSHSSTLDGIPKLRETIEKIEDKEIIRYTIRPVSYTSSYIPLVNINCVIDEKIVWSQPILILSNAWESDEINDWNGVVEIDNEDGNIKAPFFIAGKKEEVVENGHSANRLTGLVIGDLEKASVASGTGIYGFYQGQPRYYLTDSGKFYVGKDNNFISFNEGVNGRSGHDELLIKTNSFILNVNNDWLISSEGISKPQINDTTKNKNYYIYTKGKFGVDTSGTLYAKDGYFDGEINVTKLTLSGDASSDFTTLTENTIKTTSVKAENLQVNAAKVSGKLTAAEIDAGKITSGTIDVNRIAADSITASKLNITTLSSITANLGNITAGTIDAGKVTINNLTVKNANIDSLSFSKITSGSGNSNSLTASNFNITGGSINFGKGVLTINNDGKIIISSTTGGYFTMSKTLDHPYVSGLNVGMYGLSIRTGSSNSSTGTQKGWIGYYGDSIRIKTDTRKKGIYLDADYLFVGHIGASANEHEYEQGLTTTIEDVDIAYGSPVTLKFKNGILYEVS